MARRYTMFLASSKPTRSGGVLAFPDVCKVPAPPAPFVPVPYPNTQYQENLKAANKVDAMAKNGNKSAQTKQKEAIDNLYKQAGIMATSATQAVIMGKTAHGKQPNIKTDPNTSTKQNNTSQRGSRKYSSMSNVTKSHHDILRGIISNIRA